MAQAKEIRKSDHDRLLFGFLRAFLVLSIAMLAFDVVAYWKGWNFKNPPNPHLPENLHIPETTEIREWMHDAYLSWVAFRAEYIAYPIPFLSNFCIVLFIIQSLDRLILLYARPAERSMLQDLQHRIIEGTPSNVRTAGSIQTRDEMSGQEHDGGLPNPRKWEELEGPDLDGGGEHLFVSPTGSASLLGEKRKKRGSKPSAGCLKITEASYPSSLLLKRGCQVKIGGITGSIAP